MILLCQPSFPMSEGTVGVFTQTLEDHRSWTQWRFVSVGFFLPLMCMCKYKWENINVWFSPTLNKYFTSINKHGKPKILVLLHHGCHKTRLKILKRSKKKNVFEKKKQRPLSIENYRKCLGGILHIFFGLLYIIPKRPWRPNLRAAGNAR